jgi:Protein of unknown function
MPTSVGEPPDPPLSARELEVIASLSASQVAHVDSAILRHITGQWRKVALIVGSAMAEPGRVPGLPDVFFAERLRLLVASRRVELRGDPVRMRFSEARSPVAASGDI